MLFAVIPSQTRMVQSEEWHGYHGNRFFPLPPIDPLVLYGFRKITRAMMLKIGDAKLPRPAPPARIHGRTDEEVPEESSGDDDSSPGDQPAAAAAAAASSDASAAAEPCKSADGYLFVVCRQSSC